MHHIKRPKQRIKESRGDAAFTWINYSILLTMVLITLYPLIYIVSASFSDSQAVVSGKVWLWPVQPTLDGYEAIFKHKLIVSSVMNSFYYMIVGTLFNVVLTLMAAYPLSRRDFYGAKLFMVLLVFTMMFDGGLIPRYLLVKDLGMLDTRWALIIPAALSVWNVIITRTYFRVTISSELLEAAQMDGCNDFRFLWKIVLPLSAPIIAVISLFYAVGHWNQYFNALIYLKDQSLYPLQIVLKDILVQNKVDMSMVADAVEIAEKDALRQLLKYSLIVVAAGPVLVLYPFVQKHFVKGVMIGSLKE
ncbi:carbohydrate ABC transporter permease [Paenibacillus soyae]|jgi:putative aldouronate transport system permease protein|uniref:Carbohydrate ABC transporter permease n=1 Tax=Paenibacillus soyae TaxID=2969249 RepID=A0A9X2MQ44_9BACL|nr:carbohydrate ABC transporter permease [Paenibacillus soyae]MCR2804791.1 carbohydrate ABC transporter permease [Paenibacillus soyae]